MQKYNIDGCEQDKGMYKSIILMVVYRIRECTEVCTVVKTWTSKENRSATEQGIKMEAAKNLFLLFHPQPPSTLPSAPLVARKKLYIFVPLMVCVCHPAICKCVFLLSILPIFLRSQKPAPPQTKKKWPPLDPPLLFFLLSL